MATVRKTDAGFTLTELMVVVVIMSLLAAISTPVLTRDNKARKGRGWAQIVAQTVQRAHFQAMADRLNVHVKLYRARLTMEREETTVIPPCTSLPCFTLLTSLPGPVADSAAAKTVAIWDALAADVSAPSGRVLTADTPADLIFRPIGSAEIAGGTANKDIRVYVVNELLEQGHPDRGFLVEVKWLTSYVSATQMWPAPASTP
jgi:prepilin-type N-terminal cleavage/methylation domain-containing protein